MKRRIGLLVSHPIQYYTPIFRELAQRCDLTVFFAHKQGAAEQGRAGYGVAEAELHKAVLDQFPNLSLTVAGARDTADNYTVGPAVGFTLPLWNRNRGGIAIARATREQLHAEYDARLFQTRAEIDAAINALVTVRRQKAGLTAQLPEIERFAASTDRAAKRGDLAPATADTAAQALRDRRLTLRQLDQQIAEQTIALELLSGGPAEGWTK